MYIVTSVNNKNIKLDNVMQQNISYNSKKQYIIQKFNLNHYASSILASRFCNQDINNQFDQKITSFLQQNSLYQYHNSTTHSTAVNIPINFHKMSHVVHRIVDQVKAGKKIGIISDYDVDGATSAALLSKFLTKMYQIFDSTYAINTNCNHKIDERIFCKIPHRVKDGYGPSIEFMKEFQDKNIDLVITLDCGTSAFEPIAYAKENKIDVIVIDHHTPKNELPQAFAIVNPYTLFTPEDVFQKTQYMAAVGVTFCVISAIQKYISDQEYYTHQVHIDINEYLDLVAIGTVCDMMKIVDINRQIVKYGLQYIRQQKNIGIKCLIEVAQITDKIQESHIGFAIGPRINAGGRIGEDQYLGFKLLTTHDKIEAMKIATTLHNLNAIRQDINLSAENLAEISATQNENENFILSCGNWHIGIIGIVAGRLKEKFNKPAFVISIDDNENNDKKTLKGSSRSVPELHLGQLIERGIAKGILENGGGHAMAGGFSILHSKLDEFREFLHVELEGKVWSKQEITVDCVLSTQSIINQKNIILDTIEMIGPYGIGNKPPVFLLHNTHITQIIFLKEIHMRITITNDGKSFCNAMIFNGKDNILGKYAQNAYKNEVKISIIVDISRWKDDVSISIQDIIPSTEISDLL